MPNQQLHRLLNFLWNQRTNRWWWLAGLTATAFLLALASGGWSGSLVYRLLGQFSFLIGETYDRWFSQQALQNPLVLVSLSFVGGLVASLSPCILSLLPVNLTYIGTCQITSRRDALLKAGSFVLGVVTVLSLLGLFSALAAIVLVRFRGYFHLVIGTLIVLMGLSLAGLVQIPLPSLPSGSPSRRSVQTLLNSEPGNELEKEPEKVTWSQIAEPYGVGLTFALVSSPCTSPVMISVLSAAATTESQVLSTLAMVSYALGYTALIFVASLFTGFAKQTRTLLQHSSTIARVASGLLLLVGGVYVVNGVGWIVASQVR